MLRWAAILLLLVAVAGILGIMETSAPAAALARLLFFVLGLLLFCVLIGGLARRV